MLTGARFLITGALDQGDNTVAGLAAAVGGMPDSTDAISSREGFSDSRAGST